MTAKEYMNEWIRHEVWIIYHTAYRHKARFEKCALACTGKTFIDVGCALGHSTKIMSEHKEGEWFGLDFYSKVCEKVHKYNPEVQAFYSPDYELKKNMGVGFDTVVCSEVIEHIHPDKLVFFFNQLVELANKKIIITTPARITKSVGHYKTHFKREEILDLIKDNRYIKNYKLEQIESFWYLDINK